MWRYSIQSPSNLVYVIWDPTRLGNVQYSAARTACPTSSGAISFSDSGSFDITAAVTQSPVLALTPSATSSYCVQLTYTRPSVSAARFSLDEVANSISIAILFYENPDLKMIEPVDDNQTSPTPTLPPGAVEFGGGFTRVRSRYILSNAVEELGEMAAGVPTSNDTNANLALLLQHRPISGVSTIAAYVAYTDVQGRNTGASFIVVGSQPGPDDYVIIPDKIISRASSIRILQTCVEPDPETGLCTSMPFVRLLTHCPILQFRNQCT